MNKAVRGDSDEAGGRGVGGLAAEQRACAAAVAADLRALGVLPGAVVMVHSSFKSLGPVPGGIETVIQGLLLAIGAEGTLLMPALTSALRPPAIFDLLATPSGVGAITEFFRTRPGTLRSLHPTHSVCAAGRRAAELLADHDLDCTPCGPHSPFRRLVESGGRIVMLGCGLRPNTTMHALEEYLGPPYLFGKSYLFTLRDRHGQTCRKEYRTYGMAARGIVQRYDRVAELPESPAFLARGRVLQAETCLLDATALKTAVLARLRAEPCFFISAAALPAAYSVSDRGAARLSEKRRKGDGAALPIAKTGGSIPSIVTAPAASHSRTALAPSF